MSSPNGLNPAFAGPVTAQNFVTPMGTSQVINKRTLGNTEVNVFGSTNGFNGTLTGFRVTAIGSTAASISLRANNGTIATITKSATEGAITGCVFPFVAFTSSGSCVIISTLAGTGDGAVASGGGNALCEINFIADTAELA